jgi:predicted DNA repair protein MutK
MRALAVIGTAAMFMVGGGILVHGLHPVDLLFGQLTQYVLSIPTMGALLAALTPTILAALFGIAAGAVTLLVVSVFNRVRA